MLSFVIPIYKPKILDKCLESILNQSLKDYEIVCVLDGPDDSARRTIKRVTSKVKDRVKVMEIVNQGAPQARNVGATKAEGEYIIFWDCDCIIEPDAALSWVEILDRDQSVDFIYSGYKFLGEMGAYDSEDFDPWLLRCRNYISTCFPVRKEVIPKWDSKLESLQDWDFWLKVVEGGSKGKYLPGYAFSTLAPDKDSISGKGCSSSEWLKRLKAVKKKHKITNKKICVSSVAQKHEGVRLAKLIGADFVQTPHCWPHEYETIIQVGYTLHPSHAELHAQIFRDVKNKYIFWTSEDIQTIFNSISARALFGNRYDKGYVDLLNATTTQFVEDKEAKWLMDKVGLNTSVLPLPMVNNEKLDPLPKKPCFAVDIQDVYGENFIQIDKCLPDIELVVLDQNLHIKDFTGLIHFYTDRSMTPMVKRAILAGRHVISNIRPH